MPDIKQKAHKMFDERFWKISGESSVELTRKQHDFIDEIIDMAVAEERARMTEIINSQYNYHIELLKTLKDQLK